MFALSNTSSNALDEKSDIGAIISEEQLNRTLYYMKIAKENSSTKVLHGGNQKKIAAIIIAKIQYLLTSKFSK